MYGDSFCRAGKQALAHLAANPLRVAAINSVGDFVLFLAKVLVVACSVAIGSYFLKVATFCRRLKAIVTECSSTKTTCITTGCL